MSERALHVAPERGGERIAGGRAPGSVRWEEFGLRVADEADEEVERRPFLEHDIRAGGPTARRELADEGTGAPDGSGGVVRGGHCSLVCLPCVSQVSNMPSSVSNREVIHAADS